MIFLRPKFIRIERVKFYLSNDTNVVVMDWIAKGKGNEGKGRHQHQIKIQNSEVLTATAHSGSIFPL
jgi:hypothetical protein